MIVLDQWRSSHPQIGEQALTYCAETETPDSGLRSLLNCKNQAFIIYVIYCKGVVVCFILLLLFAFWYLDLTKAYGSSNIHFGQSLLWYSPSQ